jgi:hypothetical protein
MDGLPKATVLATLVVASFLNCQYAEGSSLPADAPDCAEEIILIAAKQNVAEVFNNRPESGGECALGVRESLQLSGVGDVTGGLGNAIDYLQSIPPHGFVDSGLRDPNTAAPGSIIVFSGPYSDEYLSTGHYGKPPGDWLGHVTIKGDDTYYYTDARTAEPAIGWEGGVNVDGIRDVAGIFVPDADLVAQYADRCATARGVAGSVRRSSLERPVAFSLERLAFLTLDSLLKALVREAESQAQAQVQAPGISLPSSAAARVAGHRLARTVSRRLTELSKSKSAAIAANRVMAFRVILAQAKEAAPYDEEGQMADSLARLITGDVRLSREYDSSVQSSGPDCKTQALTSEVSESLCKQSMGFDGQDFWAHSSVTSMTVRLHSCISRFNYEDCVRSH